MVLLSRQDHAFTPLGPVDDRFHVVGARRVPAIPSFVLPTPPVSFPYIDANEEIDFLATGLLAIAPMADELGAGRGIV